jgi:membrane associated rhomboid family serine protease
MEFKNVLKIALISILFLYLIHLTFFWFNLDPGFYGIVPRKVSGLIGIFTSPFVHANWPHLFSNTPPLVILISMLLYFHYKSAGLVVVIISLSTGILVWFLARPVSHIGISGVLYGLVGFIGSNGIFRKDIQSISLSLIVLVYFGGMATGLVPGQEKISWESHLFGVLSGIITSFFMRHNRPNQDALDNLDPQEEKKEYFLPRDVFKRAQNSFLHRVFAVSS